MKILNLTQHTATEDQIVFGVVESQEKDVVASYLNFDELPAPHILDLHVHRLVAICRRWKTQQIKALQSATQQSDSVPYSLMEVCAIVRPYIMIGGAPFLMAPLDKALREAGFSPVYAFSLRQSEEKIVDGEVVKTSVFKHQGFIGL
jgi:hypothetical protein